MEEAEEQPPHFVFVDEYFQVYRHRRRVFVSGQKPEGTGAGRAIPARAWRARLNLMAREPAWDRAERYRRLMAEGGHRSVRALAVALGEDFSKIARVLQILELPPVVLEALRRHAGSPAVKAHFTIKRLRQLAEANGGSDLAALIERVAAGWDHETCGAASALPAAGLPVRAKVVSRSAAQR